MSISLYIFREQPLSVTEQCVLNLAQAIILIKLLFLVDKIVLHFGSYIVGADAVMADEKNRNNLFIDAVLFSFCNGL